MTGPALRVALVAHVRHPIAPPFMGGMEAHAWHLARALTARGHEVTLFASGDSRSDAALSPLIETHYDRVMPWHRFHGTDALNALLDRTYAGLLDRLEEGRFDVVHNNSLHRFPPRFARREGQPMLTSLHVPPFGALRRAVAQSAAPWSRFTVTSAVQRSRWWPDAAPPEAHVVANGIDLTDWPFVPQGDGSAVWSGRITPNKGTHVAIDAARALGLELALFGAIEHADYFRDEVAPRLGGGIRYGGHLPQQALSREIGRASVFLFTPLWDEPFGLAAVEAMACGVPVAALPNGAVAEVVGPGGTVAADETAEALALAAGRALRLPRGEVQDYARAAFSIERMVSDYEALYRQAIAGRGRALRAPKFAPAELPARAAARLSA